MFLLKTQGKWKSALSSDTFSSRGNVCASSVPPDHTLAELAELAGGRPERGVTPPGERAFPEPLLCELCDDPALHGLFQESWCGSAKRAIHDSTGPNTA